jgi:hypothetical protein
MIYYLDRVVANLPVLREQVEMWMLTGTKVIVSTVEKHANEYPGNDGTPVCWTYVVDLRTGFAKRAMDVDLEAAGMLSPYDWEIVLGRPTTAEFFANQSRNVREVLKPRAGLVSNGHFEEATPASETMITVVKALLESLQPSQVSADQLVKGLKRLGVDESGSLGLTSLEKNYVQGWNLKGDDPGALGRFLDMFH